MCPAPPRFVSSIPIEIKCDLLRSYIYKNQPRVAFPALLRVGYPTPSKVACPVPPRVA